MPCDADKIKAVAIIVKDLNVMERVEINADGQYLAVNDTSEVFPEFERLCRLAFSEYLQQHAY
jgi:hypothetical protein